MEHPLLSSDDLPGTAIQLQKRQTGDKEIPETLYAQEVAQLVVSLEKNDEIDMAQVVKFGGFKENAYRFLFAYEDNFQEVTPHLQTILPTGKIENTKDLVPEKERGIIAYTYSQRMLDSKAAKVFQDRQSPFILDKNGVPYVVQTWPTKCNEKFKKEFNLVKYPTNPDPDHFKEEALEDFKNVALQLFQRPLDEPPPLWLGRRQSENTLPMYQGTGYQLMALLRLRKDIRDELRITEILEPDGFVSKFTAGKDEGKKPFHMDLSGQYALYQKQGWETMACVKPLAQFDFEAERYPQAEIPPATDSGDGVINFPLDMEWVSGPAYLWTWLATAVIWGGAVITVTFAFFFYKRADWWKHGAFSDFWQHFANTITAVIIMSAILFGLYADHKAMSYCIIPWLQNVKRSCKIPFYGPASCNQFWYFSLATTMSQMLTIQLNAWVLANTVRNTDCKQEHAWEWLWEQGGVGFCPFTLVHCVLLCWGLSSLQLFLPSFLTLTNINPKSFYNKMKNKVNMHRPIDSQSYKFHCTSLLSGTLAEGVTLMALASGMRYTGAVSLSYPLAMIEQIKEKKIGFMIKTEVEGKQVWEPTHHGWEFKCVKELQKLYSIQAKRLCFILVFKYACQMNVQVTLFILKGTIQSTGKFNYAAAFGELVSLGAMSLGIASELYDLMTLLGTFLNIRKSVNECLKNKNEDDKKKKEGNEKTENLLARHFFKVKGGEDKEEAITFADLKFDYRRTFVVTAFVLLVTAFAMWLISYQLLKFINFWRCPDGLWSFKKGCLKLDKLRIFLDSGVCKDEG